MQKYLEKYFQIAPEKLPGEHCLEVAGLNVLFQHTSRISPADLCVRFIESSADSIILFMRKLSKRI